MYLMQSLRVKLPSWVYNNEKRQGKIDDRCVKCRKCHDIFYGCLLANSMRLPKGESKMGSINRYGNMGVEFDWLTQYFNAVKSGFDFGHRVIPLERIKLNISKVSFRIVE